MITRVTQDALTVLVDRGAETGTTRVTHDALTVLVDRGAEIGTIRITQHALIVLVSAVDAPVLSSNRSPIPVGPGQRETVISIGPRRKKTR